MADRVEQLLQAGNEASARVRNLWITFLLFGTYLAIAIGGTTHRQMLLEAPIVLPILGAELPLVHFYQVAPILFLIFHFYLLVQLYLLAQKLHLLEDAITGPAVPKGARGDLRARTDNFLITQLLVGKTGGVLPRLFIRWAAWLTMIFAPVLLLLAFQVQFLAYHDVFTTWLHRATLIACVLIVWLLWPVITHPGGRLGGVFTALFIERPLMFATAQYGWQKALTARLKARDWRGAFALILQGYREIGRASNRFFYDLLAMVVLVGASLAVLGFSVLVATIPAEEMERWLLERIDLVAMDNEAMQDCFLLRSSESKEYFWWYPRPVFNEPIGVHRCHQSRPQVFGIPISMEVFTSKRPRKVRIPDQPDSVWWLTAIFFEGNPDWASSRATSPFSRNLVLIDDPDLVALNDDALEKVERTLILRGRDLRYARFDRSDLRKADFFRAKLVGAAFYGARLDGATLVQSGLEGVDLTMASLMGANVEKANLRYANLGFANMQGAYLGNAQMKDAFLGAANMRGAVLEGAMLQDVYLGGARMQAVDLTRANLQGANLQWAKLQGANLQAAQMQNANLQATHSQGANLRWAWMWNVEFEDADLSLADVRDASIGVHSVTMTEPGTFAEILKDDRQEASGAELDPLLEGENRSQNKQKPWLGVRAPPTDDWSMNAEEALAALLADVGCAIEDAPYVARGLLRRMEFERRSSRQLRPYHALLAKVIGDPRKCPGSLGLTEKEITELRTIVDGKP